MQKIPSMLVVGAKEAEAGPVSVRNFLHLRVANLGGQLFVAIVQMDADAMALKCIGDVLGVVGHLFADRANFDLHRSEPKRERSGIVLDQYAEEALDRAKQRAMDH